MEETLTLLEELDRRLEAIRDLSHRVDRINENCWRFGSEVADLATSLEIPSDGDAIDLAGLLLSRLQQARRDADRHRELTPALRRRVTMLSAPGRSIRMPEATLDVLRWEARCSDDEALAEAILRSSARRLAEERRDDFRQQLLSSGDGRTSPN